MGERDAFGREKGEDSLADMGWKPSGAPAWEPGKVTPGDPLGAPAAFDAGAAGAMPAPPATPTPAAIPAAPTPPAAPASAFSAGEAASPFARPAPRPPGAAAASAFSAGEASAPFAKPKPRPAEPPRPKPPAPTLARPPRRRGGPSLARLIILVAIVGAIGIGASAVVRVGGHAVDGLRDKIEAVTPKTPASPSPVASGSLLRAGPLRGALAKLPPGRLVFIRISAGSIDAQVIRAGKLHTVHMATAGPSITATTPANAGQKGFKLDPDAPLRVARTAARRAGRSVNDVDYVVGTGLGWELFFKGDARHYHATPSGRKVAKVG